MPEIVRKHTHFHKVYKLLQPEIESPIHHNLPPHQHPTHGKPHVSLLGYTTRRTTVKFQLFQTLFIFLYSNEQAA